MRFSVTRQARPLALISLCSAALLLAGCFDNSEPDPVLLGDDHRFPQDPGALANDYNYHFTVRLNGDTATEGRGWMRQSFSANSAADNPYMEAIWAVREDYYPRGGGDSYSELWALGYSPDDHWALLTNRAGNEFAADGSGQRGVIWVHNLMSEGEIYEPQFINWPGEHGDDHSLYGRVRVMNITTLDTAAGPVETYHFRLDASDNANTGFTSGNVLLRYDYWLNPKLGIVRERAVLEEPSPDSENGYTVSEYERDLSSYILPSD